MSIYATCAAAHGEDDRLVMQCISNWVEEKSIYSYDHQAELHTWLLLLAGSMVFFMQAGFAMVCAGAIRKKNVNNTMIKNLLDACGAGIAFFVCGYAFAFGTNEAGALSSSTLAGSDNFLLIGYNVDPALFFFQYAFSATTATIVAGTLAERCQMISYFVYSFTLIAVVYPVIAHSVWSENGFFSPGNSNPFVGTGMVDFSGSGVVHMTGGCTALYATLILGPRRGRFHDMNGKELERPGLAKGHSMSLQMLGTMILWFCWYGFNAGSTLLLNVDNTAPIAARAAVNTTLSAAAGTLSAMITNAFITKRKSGQFTLDIAMAMNGCLTGLVAVTAGCGVIDYWAALVIGIIAGWVYIVVDAKLIEYKIDDAVSAIPVHLGGGLWGVFSAGLFAVPDLLTDAYGVATYPGLFYTETGKNLVPAQMVGALFIIGWTMITMVPFFLILNYMGLFRVNELEELIGLDASYDTTKPLRLDEGSETSDEMLRFAAYRQRLYEKRLLLDSSNNQVVEPMSAKQLLSNYLEEEKAKTVAHAKKHHTNHTRSRKRSQSLESIEASMVPTVSTAMELHTSSDTMGTFDLESP